MASDDDLQRSLREHPRDPEHARVYADWLAERGHHAQEQNLRAQVEAWRAEARMRELEGQLDAGWLEALEPPTQHARLTLRPSGREIQLESLAFSAVYAGLLEGVPTRQMNQRIIERAVEAAQRSTRHAPLLIEPAQTPIELSRDYPFGEPALLPSYCVTGGFRSSGPDPLHMSSLTAVWFQADLCWPAPRPIQQRLAGIDWDARADVYEL